MDVSFSNKDAEPRHSRTAEGAAGRSGATSSSGESQSSGKTNKRVKVYLEKINRVRAKKRKTGNGCRICKRVHRKMGTFADGTADYGKSNAPKRSQAARDNYVVLQACNDSPTLRYLTVAIAALGKSKSSFWAKEKHRQFAVIKYGQALRSMREMVASSNDIETIRTTLIASLLIFSFESMHGNPEQALSSIPGIEDEVLEIFVRLDNTIMSSILGDPYRPRYSFLDMTYIDEHFYMPPSFRDLVEAKGYLEHFQSELCRTDISVQRVYPKIDKRPKELFEVEAREILDLTRRVVLDHRFKKSFGFDCGVVPALFIAVMIFRNRGIREEAIRILRLAEGRIEVVWDTAKVAELGERMLRAEEQGQTVLAV
ncbi:hypothetical protein F5882DRAFT_460800 [Hyaloscypha sp. PMI_1271]|nr:hypothetical protein F5882DRAFT_460800 [Hyaloscypha sp. PMI_1271]